MGTEFGHIRFTGCIELPTPLPESNSVISLFEWNFVVVKFDGIAINFYLNGQLDGQCNLTGTLCTNDQPLNIGVDFPGADEYWHGKIDDIRIYNCLLNDLEILDLYHENGWPPSNINPEPISDNYIILQNFPNPFNPTTKIFYAIPQSEFVNLSIYNANGQLVEILINEHKNAGHYSVNWQPKGISSGIYYYKLKSKNFTKTSKCILLK